MDGRGCPDAVDVLRGVRELEFVYPLLHALVGRSLREFFVRAAALEALALSAQLRAVLDRVPLDHRSARRVVREIHDLLSRLLGGSAELHSAVTEVGRQYLHLTAGVTVEQIVRALMRESRDELAAVGREALLPAVAPPPLLTTDAVAHAAEVHVARERRQAAPVAWEEPPQAPRVTDAAAVPAEVLAWVADLVAVARGGEVVAFARLVPRENAGASFMRASLLPLAGDGRAGEGVAGQLGAVAVHIISTGDGWPEPLDDAPLSRLTPGEVVPRAQ